MLGSVVREDGLGEQHLQEPTEAALQGDFAGHPIFVWLPAAESGEQLHLGPLEADAQVKEKACRHPAQGQQGADALPIEQLHLFPAQRGFHEFEGIPLFVLLTLTDQLGYQTPYLHTFQDTTLIFVRTPCVRRYAAVNVTHAKPGRGRWSSLGRSLNDYRSISVTSHICLLESVGWFFPLKEAHVYPGSLQVRQFDLIA